MSNLTVSLELAKKMKELGWKKQTHFRRDIYIRCDGFMIQGISLPTAQEILDELPPRITVENITRLLEIYKDIPEAGCFAGYNDHTDEMPLIRCQSMEGNLAEALGHLWCWCKENNYL